MGAIGGVKREGTGEGFLKQVGLFEANIIAINPSIEEYKDKLGMELKEDSKATEYLGTSKDGNSTLRLDIWLEEVNNKNKFKVSFFLENKERQNKDETKKQYINSIGSCSWASDPNDLPQWFSAREYRVANTGEEDLYKFLRVWLGELDYRNAETTLSLDWKKLMKGQVKDLRDQINGEWCTPIVALATIITREKEGEVKEYQGVYNRGFLPSYTLKQFKLSDYSNSKVLASLTAKKPIDLKIHEKFVVKVAEEYGCKDYYTFKDLKEYNSSENLVASNEVLSEEDAEY